MSDPKVRNVVVLASGRGSNFAALLDAQKHADSPYRIRALLSDKPAAAALDRARDAGIVAITLAPRDFNDRAAFDRALFARAAEFHPDLIVLAGYMRVIDAAALAGWHGRIVNIHPSLLPNYPGLHTHTRVLETGDNVHGASVHFVTAQLDGGPVIAQAEMPVLAGDTPGTLAARLLPLENRLLAASVDGIARGRVALGDNGVEFDGKPLVTPLRLHTDGSLAVLRIGRH